MARPHAFHRQINAWGCALQHPVLRQQLPLPPMFDHCTAVLTAGDESAAISLYWSVIQRDQPLVEVDCAIAVLEQAVRLNPWVGEPQMVLAQLYLSVGRMPDAAQAAQSALGQCMRQTRAVGRLDGLGVHFARVG